MTMASSPSTTANPSASKSSPIIVPLLPLPKQNALLPLLHSFTTRHQSHHRPIVLVTSGGTATDLEVNAVRFLDNFSTGLRGAISVEEFLKRGYAVIHLWRRGSAAPYTRVLNGLLSGNGGRQTDAIDFESLGKLFEGQQFHFDEDDEYKEEDMQDENEIQDDPWMSSPPSPYPQKTQSKERKRDDVVDDDDEYYSKEGKGTSFDSNKIQLNKRLKNSTILQTKLRERAHVVQEGLLLTVPFRTVEEYLAKLQLCTEAINDCQSLGLIYLTAAVSDFYIPDNMKSEHKIQSRDYGLNGSSSDKDETGKKDTSSIQVSSGGGITIQLSPVPKCISLLREKWAPDAFCVSFKLETDKNILFDKSKMAMEKYGVHMVIGNLLATRHEKVSVIQRNNGKEEVDVETDENGMVAEKKKGINIEMLEITKGGKGMHTTRSSDELEDALISHIVDQHFHYISTHIPTVSSLDDDETKDSCLPRTALMAGAEAASRHNAYLREKRRKLQNELYWKKVRGIILNVAGHAAGVYLTFMVRKHLLKRIG